MAQNITLTFTENGKPYEMPNIPNHMVLNYLMKVLFKAAIEGTSIISHLTITKTSQS